MQSSNCYRRRMVFEAENAIVRNLGTCNPGTEHDINRALPAPIAVSRRCHLSIDNLFCFFQRITQATEIPRRIFDLKLAAAKSNTPVKTLNPPPEISRAIETTPHLPHLTPIPNCAGAP